MSARRKRKCEECGRKANMAFDPQGRICVDCLEELKHTTVSLHKQGKMAYHEAEEILRKRLRISRFQAEEILFPPLGDGDYPSSFGGLRLSENITELIENDDS